MISELILYVARTLWYKLFEPVILLTMNWRLKINVYMQTGHLK